MGVEKGKTKPPSSQELRLRKSVPYQGDKIVYLAVRNEKKGGVGCPSALNAIRGKTKKLGLSWSGEGRKGVLVSRSSLRGLGNKHSRQGQF